MPQRDQDETPYFTPGTAPGRAEKHPVDEQQYSTLKMVGGMLTDALDGLSKDFNAFDVLTKEDRTKAADNLLRQVEAKQMAYDILLPAVEAVVSAIQKIDVNYKQ